MGSGIVARMGLLALAGGLALPAIVPGDGARAATALPASEIRPAGARAEVGAPVSAARELPETPLPVGGTVTSAALDAAPEPPPAPTEPLPGSDAQVADGVVLASWYGPGFYGNRTACGLTFTPEIVGVAHRTLACGTRLEMTSPAGTTVVAAVIDRGPYAPGRALDLSSALRLALRCTDLCRVQVTVLP